MLPTSMLRLASTLVLSCLVAASTLYADDGAVATQESSASRGGNANYDLLRGTGDSSWGFVPSQSDSVQGVFEARPRPAWEYVALAPYQLIDVPLRLTLGGIAATVKYMDGSEFVHTVARFFGPKQVPYGFLLNLRAGGLAGTGGGITLYHNEFLGPHNRFRLGTSGTFQKSQKYTLGILFNEAARTQFEFGAGYRLRPNARFFGIGPDTQEASESYYSQETSWVGLSWSQAAVENVRFEASTVFSGVGTRRTGADDADKLPLLVQFPGGATPPGYAHRSDGVTFSFGLYRDTTSETGRPESGGVQRVKAAYFNGVDTEKAQFWSFRFEAERFLPLWFTERALALRGYANWLDQVGDNPIPFQRLLTNDEPDLLRGFRDFRWRDTGIISVIAEYRFPLFAASQRRGVGIDAYLFSDFGQVFGDADQIALDRFTDSYGAGLRFVGSRGFVGRFDVGVSDEETVLRLQFEQIFQYAKGGLYNGRDKSVLR